MEGIEVNIRTLSVYMGEAYDHAETLFVKPDTVLGLGPQSYRRKGHTKKTSAAFDTRCTGSFYEADLYIAGSKKTFHAILSSAKIDLLKDMRAAGQELAKVGTRKGIYYINPNAVKKVEDSFWFDRSKVIFSDGSKWTLSAHWIDVRTALNSAKKNGAVANHFEKRPEGEWSLTHRGLDGPR